MKEIRTFSQEIIGELKNHNLTGEIKEVEKANGVMLTGIAIKTDGNASPTIYVDDMLKKGLSVEEAAAQITAIINKDTAKDIDISWFYDFSKVKPMLRARLFNQATNAEVSKKAPAPFDDLIIVPYITGVVIDGKPDGAIKVKADHLKIWDVTPDEVIEIAESNSKNDAEAMSMSEVLRQMGYPAPPFVDDPMTVVSNREKCFGAYAIIAMLDELKERYTNGFTVLPSSVHEVIIIDSDDQETLDSMVEEVNAEQVDYQEQLSNHSYRVAA